MDFYILMSDCGKYYKIGISKDYENRFHQIRHSSPFYIDVFFAARLSSEYIARAYERFFLSLFAKNKTRGEWLMFDPAIKDNLKNIISFVEIIEVIGGTIILAELEDAFIYLVDGQRSPNDIRKDVLSRASKMLEKFNE